MQVELRKAGFLDSPVLSVSFPYLPLGRSHRHLKAAVIAMTKTKGKGGINRHRSKNENNLKKDLIFKKGGQEYVFKNHNIGKRMVRSTVFWWHKETMVHQREIEKKIQVSQILYWLVYRLPGQRSWCNLKTQWAWS